MSLLLRLSLFYLWLPGIFGYIGNQENALRHAIFQRNKAPSYALPVANLSEGVSVKFALDFLHLVKLDEVEQTLIIKCIAYMEWEDVGLKWNKNDYGGVDNVNIAPDWIWKPDLGLYNSAKGEDTLFLGPGLARVFSNGVVKWQPPVTIHTFCPLNFLRYPRDEHICTLKIGSWTYDGAALSLKVVQLNESKTDFLDARISDLYAWQVNIPPARTEVIHYSCCPEPYMSIHYDIKLKRRTAFYNSSLLPSFFAILIIANALFWLPPTSAEKTTLGGLVVLLLLTLLVHLLWKIPNTTNEVPSLIGICAALLFFSTISFLVTIVTLNLSQRCTQPATFLLHVGNSKVARIFGVSIHADQTSDANCEHVEQNSSQWFTIARAIDRVCFCVYFLASVIFAHLFCI